MYLISQLLFSFQGASGAHRPVCLRLRRSASALRTTVDRWLILAFARISARTASQLLFSFEKMVGSSLESRNALSAYTSYKHAFLASRLCSPLVGSSGLEPPTSRLSGARSNRLSYEPIIPAATYFPGPSPAKYHQPSVS